MKLFLVVLGGRTSLSTIELHDVRFVVGDSIEATFPELRRQWFGELRGLHLDSYLEVRCIDGFQVALRPEPFEGPERLWFVNLGAYDPEQLAELHRFGLVVAATPQAAKARAKRRWLVGAEQQHKDDLCAVDDCLALEAVQRWHVHLMPEPDGRSQPMRPDWYGYRRIDRPTPSPGPSVG